MNDMISLPASPGETVRFDYVPRPGLLRLTIVNFLLGVVTLTVYRFWAKTNTRRHIWSCVHINGQPLEYTGRGIELFKGAMIVFLLLILPFVLLIAGLTLALGPEHPAIVGVQMLFFLIVWVLWGAAVYRARRYQLSRTLWRGIRGSLEGSAVSYSLLYFGSLLARGITFGWSTPAMNLNLQQMMIGDMRFGDMPFRFKGRAGPLYPRYALCWFLTLIAAVALVVAVALIAVSMAISLTDIFEASSDESAWAILGGLLLAAVVVYFLLYPLIWSFYTAKELAAFASYTTLDKARFRLDATAGSIFRLALGNFLLWLFTLGIAAPFIQQRLVRYLCERMSVDGTVDIDRILQSKAPLDATGEGLAAAFDVGGI